MEEQGIHNADKKALQRAQIIQEILEKRMNHTEAAKILSLTRRQLRRLVKRFREEGKEGMVHKLKGRPSNRRIRKETRDKIFRLYREHFQGYGPSYISDKLLEKHNININHETLRNWLLESGDWTKSRENNKKYLTADKKQYHGEIFQINNCFQRYFGNRKFHYVFMVFRDRTTENIFGRLYGKDGKSSCENFKNYLHARCGIPLHAEFAQQEYEIYAVPERKEKRLYENKSMRDPEKITKNLTGGNFSVSTPEATNKMQRFLDTLEESLMKSMKSESSTIEKTNNLIENYTSEYNRKITKEFEGKKNRESFNNTKLKRNKVSCRRAKRTLTNNTIKYKKNTYKIEGTSCGEKVVVEDQDGAIFIKQNGKGIKFKKLAASEEKSQKNSEKNRLNGKYTPSPDHPWKKYKCLANTNKHQKFR